MSNLLIEKTNELLSAMEADMVQWYNRSEFSYGPEYAADRMENLVWTWYEGRNFIKLVKIEESDHGHRECVLGFVVKKSPKAIDNKTNQPFKIGDMLMAAGYNKPATNFARGNVLDGYKESAVRWTGI